MKKNKITKNTLKFIIALEVFLFGVLGLVISSLYFAWNYSNFMNQVNNSRLFWIGFVVLVSIIISSTLILIGSAIMFVIIANWWNNKPIIKEE